MLLLAKTYITSQRPCLGVWLLGPVQAEMENSSAARCGKWDIRNSGSPWDVSKGLALGAVRSGEMHLGLTHGPSFCPQHSQLLPWAQLEVMVTGKPIPQSLTHLISVFA